MERDNLELKKIAEKYMGKPPTNLNAMADEMRVTVRYSAKLPKNIAGKIQRNQHDKYIITVNANDNWRRQRFTLAHELSHFMLHRGLIGDGVTEDALYRGLPGPVEREANKHAVNMLMPSSTTRQAVRDGSNNPEKLAKLFWVSEPAAQVRWKELGLDAHAQDWH